MEQRILKTEHFNGRLEKHSMGDDRSNFLCNTKTLIEVQHDYLNRYAVEVVVGYFIPQLIAQMFNGLRRDSSSEEIIEVLVEAGLMGGDMEIKGYGCDFRTFNTLVDAQEFYNNLGKEDNNV